jgi:hypothetical protein
MPGIGPPIVAGVLGRRLVFRNLGVNWARDGLIPRAIIYGPESDAKRTVAGEAVENNPLAFAIRTLTNPFPRSGTYHIWLELRNVSGQIWRRSPRPIVLPVL